MTVPATGRDDDGAVSVVSRHARVASVRLTRADAPSSGVAARPWASGAVEVEALAVWAYRDQKVDRFQTAGLHAIEAAYAGFEPHGSSTDGCAALARIAHMGCRLDVGTGRIKDAVHAAAEVVASLLSSIDGGRLVSFHARTGGRPEGWAMPARRYRPVMWVKPGVEAAWERTDDGRGRFTPLISLGSEADVAACRRDYTLWWNALDTLAWRLSAKALGFAV
ncbi:MAG: hypothetical protein FJ335_12045, partial [Sphingomonadales bacterium]|nr:hypothetical protein [Sphingomonadales bacterium]